ncbi:MAG: hypothetical protein ACXW0Z_19765 [Gemmatirosa sp.]
MGITVALAENLSRFGSKLRAPLAAVAGVALLAACGPIARVPLRPVPVPGAADGRLMIPSAGPINSFTDASPVPLTGLEIPGHADSAQAALARTLAPVLYLHRDEPFPLSRVVAVVHPERRVVAYHLLWQDDAYGAWIPGTKPTDEEIVWVGYDASGAPTDMWTYWHGTLLHAPWTNRQVEVDVQWGKHGSLPRGTREEDLPRGQGLKAFYRMTYALPDFWLGNLTRRGPWCFCQSYGSYRQFTKPQLVAEKLDAVVVAHDPRAALGRVFGTPYSNKPWWPWLMAPDRTPTPAPLATAVTDH